MSDITSLSAVDLAAAIAARRLSSIEVMTAHLDRIEALNPKVNAIVALQDREALMARARAMDDRAARGDLAGPLHGLPHALKDLQPVRGIRSTWGSPLLKDFVPEQDGLSVARLRAAGAIFIGKTNTPEFGLGSHTFNPVYGATANAYDPARSAGGSSGGAAVTLALRMAPLADGSDYGGSLRNPAGWNNVFGFRVSHGVVPEVGEDAWTATMSVTGPMARSVRDLALLLSVQAGRDDRAPLSNPGDGQRFLAPLEADMRGKRIGWLGDLGGWAPYEPGVLEVCREALKRFEALGCQVEEALPDRSPEDAWRAFQRLRHWQAGAGLRRHHADPAKRALMKPELIWEVECGRKISAYDVTDASIARTVWSESVHRLFDRFDYLVAPTAQVFPFDIHETWPREIAGQAMTTYHEWMKAVCLISLAGCPALAAPAGFSAEGLPMGLQIIGPVGHDIDCLRLAHAYEAASATTIGRLPTMLRA